jgi:RIP homotypic interaction motif
MARMDPVTLIVTALAAGGASALQDDAKAVLARLRGLAGKRLSACPAGQVVLAQHEQAPDAYAKSLEYEFAQSGAAADPELISVAAELMRLLDASGAAAAGKYNVTVHGSSGVQVGDNNTQVNHFGGISAGRDVYHADRDMTINPR